jgi:cytoskeletal protein RodZ
MSLINDALRRARQAQQEAPPPPVSPTHFKPVEPKTPPVRHGLGLLVPVSLGIIALLALLLLWEISKREPSSVHGQPKSTLNVAARVVVQSGSSTSSSKDQALSPSSEGGTNSSSITASAPTISATATRVDPPDSTNTSSLSVPIQQADTNHASAEVASATSNALKLQGIVFNPRRPSALINGRVMFVGDRVRDLRITAIHPGDVVLTGPGRTNILSLEP